jgi:hypothetical protein
MVSMVLGDACIGPSKTFPRMLSKFTPRDSPTFFISCMEIMPEEDDRNLPSV